MTPITKQTDTEIQKKVLDELRWDTRVNETAIGVVVDRGVVTLLGTVDSWVERVAAQEAAHRVSSLHDVANDIQVKLPGSLERSDADIARAIRSTLEWDVLVPHERVTTSVSQGVVTLEGQVDTLSQRDDAARSIRNLAGVVEVRNLIVVEPVAIASHTVRDAIDQALARHAARAASHVQIAVSEGKVTLTGAVPSWVERDAIEGAVRGTPGVRRLESQLRLQV